MKFDNCDNVLSLIAIMTSSTFSKQCMTAVLEDRFVPLPKAVQFCIDSEEDKRLENLEQLVKKVVKQSKEVAKTNEEMVKQNRRLQREMAELKCKYLPVTVDVTQSLA